MKNIFKNLTYSLTTMQSYSPLFNPQRTKVSIKVYREIKHLNTSNVNQNVNTRIYAHTLNFSKFA